jgi:hypothetical protein
MHYLVKDQYCPAESGYLLLGKAKFHASFAADVEADRAALTATQRQDGAGATTPRQDSIVCEIDRRPTLWRMPTSAMGEMPMPGGLTMSMA